MKIYTCRKCGAVTTHYPATRITVACRCGGLMWADGAVEDLPTDYKAEHKPEPETYARFGMQHPVYKRF